MAPGDLARLPGHIQFGDFLIGPGTPVRWKSVAGWEETPGLDSGTVPRSSQHGAFPGVLLAQPRTITVNDLVLRTEPGAMSAAVRALAAATALRDDELPLAIKLDDGPALMCWARCLRRSVPVASGYRVGVAEGGALQFEATDPRRYSLVEQRVEARLPRPEPGLDWHLAPGPEGLVWPLDFGPPGSTGGMTVTNEGDAPVSPVIEFRGPVDRPSLTNVSTGDVVEYDIVLDSSDVLTVDTGAGTVLLNGSTSRLGTVTGRSVPEAVFTLLPGTSTLAYRAAPGSSDPRSSVAVSFRSAYW
ncbi:hypothetical protein [Streptomyces sp. C36]|uniref:phage distal tail protein n=1 Tax=Streptomyces sp. C36 TaxID=3237122 RepID=UPI0034C67BE3